MNDHLQIVPLCLLMVMGPQIVTAIFLVTSRDPIKNSLALVVGVFAAATLGLAIWTGVVEAIGIDPSGDDGGPTTLDWIVSGLLALAAARAFMTRGTAETPKWMRALVEATPRRALTLGFLLILLMPTDIIATIATANFVHDNDLHWYDGWPLVAGTVLLMALPVLGYSLLGRRARAAMPRVRDWLTTHGWLVNIVVIVYFIYQLLG
jgi:hypothetical protein